MFPWEETRNSQTLQQLFPSSCSPPDCVLSLQMSFAEDLPDMDGADLLGLLFQGEDDGSVEPLFPVEDELMESWLSDQDVRLHVSAASS